MQFNLLPFDEPAAEKTVAPPLEVYTDLLPWATIRYDRYQFGELLTQEYEGRTFSLLQYIITLDHATNFSFVVSQEQASLFLLLEGYVECLLNDGMKYYLKEREAGLFMLPPGSHRVQLGAGRCHGLHITFSESWAQELAEDTAVFRRLSQSSSRMLLPLPVAISHPLLAVVRKVLTAGKAGSLLNLELKAAILELVHTYLKELKVQQQTASLPEQLHKDKMLAIRQYIVQHPNIQLTKLSRLAKQYYLNKGTISKCFYKMFGVYLADFALSQVMEKAWHELTHTNKPVAELADELGYSSNSNFSRAFSEYFKQSPQSLRRQQQAS